MTVKELIHVLQTECVPDEEVHVGYDACCVEELTPDCIQRGADWRLTIWAN